MSRSRMMKDDEPTDPQAPSPRTTIVGGRPPERGASPPPVPTGIQRLLRLASVDEQFQRELVERRAAVAGAAEVRLTASEAAVLAAIPAPQLQQMATEMPPPAPPRREFLRQTAATAVVLLGGAALGQAVTGCRDKPKGPDVDAPDRPEHREMDSEGGAAPHLPPDEQDRSGPDPSDPSDDETPPDRPDQRMEAPGGAAPDLPPERPEERETVKVGGAAPDLPPERPQHPDMQIRSGALSDEPPESSD